MFPAAAKSFCCVVYDSINLKKLQNLGDFEHGSIANANPASAMV